MVTDDWSQGRREAALAHSDALARAEAQESAKAQDLINGFVRAAYSAGIEPVRLDATSYQGTGRYRTDIMGWYLRRDRTIGIGTDRGYYILQVAGGLAARLRTHHLDPRDPPLIVGKGGRDGDTIDLAALLAARLAEGTVGQHP
jgi:hypothetical protein